MHPENAAETEWQASGFVREILQWSYSEFHQPRGLCGPRDLPVKPIWY